MVVWFVEFVVEYLIGWVGCIVEVVVYVCV